MSRFKFLAVLMVISLISMMSLYGAETGKISGKIYGLPYILAMGKYEVEPKLSELREMWKYYVQDKIWLANRAAPA